MKTEDIPYDYTYCYATDEQCTQTGHCLRRHAAKMNEEQPEPYSVVSCVTPTYVAKVATGKPCKHYRSDTPLRYARGMNHLFDDVPQIGRASCRERV